MRSELEGVQQRCVADAERIQKLQQALEQAKEVGDNRRHTT